MPEDFVQYLIIILIMLLFGKDYVPAVLAKFGIAIKKNGNGEALKKLETNHFPHLEVKVDKLLELQQEMLFILKDFKEDGIKLKK